MARDPVEQRKKLHDQLRDIVSDDNIYIYDWEGPNIEGPSKKVRSLQHMPDSIVRHQTIALEG